MDPISKMKCERIKAIVEEVSGYPDIGVKARTRPYPELRKIYTKLCRLFSSAPLTLIGLVVNSSHTMTVHNIAKFNELHESGGLDFLYVYDICLSLLQDEREKNAYDILVKNNVNIERVKLPTVFKPKDQESDLIIAEKDNEIKRLKGIIQDINQAFSDGDALSKEYVFELKSKIKSFVLKNNL